MQFEHLLAAVQFKMGDMVATQVNSITISGIKGGAVTFGYSDGKWTPTSYGNTNADYALTLGTQDQEGNWEAGKLANTLNLDDAADITGNKNNSMLLIAPQTLSGAKVTVNYTELLVLVNGQPITTEKYINLPEHIWEAGKTYAYTLNIKSSLDIQIPRPEDQDAHFIRVPLTYNLSNVPNEVTDLSITVTEFKDNSSSNIEAYILKKSTIDENEALNSGLWSSQQQTIIVNHNSNGDETTREEGEVVNILTPANNTLNLTAINAPANSDNSLVLFIGENNGYTDREVTLRITGKYKNKTINVGSGTFKQLCPNWNNQNYGCERIEETTEYPYGYCWTGNVTYTNRTFLARFFYSSILENAINVNVSGNQDWTFDKFLETKSLNNGFIEYDIWTSLITTKYIGVLRINYGALANVGENAQSDDDGLTNTYTLKSLTIGNNIESVENTIDKANNEYITKSGPGLSNEEYSIYAVSEALKRNKVKFIKTILRQAGKDDIPVISFDLVENKRDWWYLPAVNQAKSISDPKYPLKGSYWSSTACSDNVSAKIFNFDNEGKYVELNSSDMIKPRTDNYKIRVVRNKPNIISTE